MCMRSSMMCSTSLLKKVPAEYTAQPEYDPEFMAEE